MSKRRVEEKQDSESDIEVSSTESENEGEGLQVNVDEGQPEEDILNVDFDYFDLNENVDFLALKNFLAQLFGDDASLFDLSSLADLTLTKGVAGSAIKTEGKESDPFALLSVVSLSDNMDKQCVKTLVNYILDKSSKQTEFHAVLEKLLTSRSTGAAKKLRVGLIISERVINMPVEVVPPMYQLLLDDMAKEEEASEKKSRFDLFLVISRVYEFAAAKIDADDSQKAKKKKLPAKPEIQMDYFHYEDPILEKNASHRGYFKYSHADKDTDSRRVFNEYGIDPMLSLILLNKEQLSKATAEMQKEFAPN